MALVFRGERFLSIPEIAERLGVTRLTVHRWLNGKRRAPEGIRFDDVIRDSRTRQAYVSEVTVRRVLRVLPRRRPRPPRPRRS